MFQSFLSGLVSKDYKSLEKLTEKRFLSTLQSQSDNLGKFDLRYSPSKLEDMVSESYSIDKLLVKGIKFNREDNDSNHDYMYVDTHENLGLRFYLHKYFLGFHPYYMEIKNKEFFERQQQPDFQNKQSVKETLTTQDEFRDMYFRQRKEFNQRSLSMVLRATFLVNNYGKLESLSGPESLYDPTYSGNHIVIFECQLKSPSQMALIDHDHLEYIKLQRLSMSNWRIVDVDHFMKGNSFFNKLVSDVDWHNDVEARIGVPDKRNKTIKEPDQVKDVRELLNLYESYINMKEPRSNRGLEDFKSKEELEAEKQAAKERAQKKQAEAAAAKKKVQEAAAGAQEAAPEEAPEGKAAKKADKKKKEPK